MQLNHPEKFPMSSCMSRWLTWIAVIAAITHSGVGQAQQIFANGFESATLFAYDFGNKRLISFSSDTPGTLITDVALTGLTAGENLTGIDFRPANGQLYALAVAGSVGRVVAINTLSGTVTPVSAATFVAPSGVFFGVDFNPVVDRVRYTSEVDANGRLNPDDGTMILPDTTLAYLAGDPNMAANPSVVHVAYTQSAGVTTLYGIDSTTDALVRIGGEGGIPSPNSGQLTTIGALGVAIASAGGFDILKNTTTAYAALRVAGVSVLYSIDLASGAATAIGAIGPALSALTIDGLALAP
jgi:hypothetical protein